MTNWEISSFEYSKFSACSIALALICSGKSSLRRSIPRNDDESLPPESPRDTISCLVIAIVASATAPADAKFVGIVETVEETGFPYFGGSQGVQTSDMGYVLDTRIVKVKIRVIKNND